MIKTAVKTTILLSGFLIFLSLTIDGRTIFSYIYNVMAPATKYGQNVAQDFIDDSIANTQTYSKKLFNNSVPKLKDTVDSKLSSRQKLGAGEPAERITHQEKAELDQLIKNH